MTTNLAIGERKRILCLDGGGTRGVFTIEILAAMEQLLRAKLNKPHLVLADHFQFMAGTSTGAIIATLLSWGEPVDKIRSLYYDRCAEIFPPAAPWRVSKFPRLLRRLGRALYGEESLSAFLEDYFMDKDTGKTALLSSSQLRTTLLLCMRNSSTGSAWPITNNPDALYNERSRENCNLDLPLWKLVRASTAAPIFFLPELIEVGKAYFAFMDGGLTPYNNPSVIAFLTATEPCYRMNWPTGVDKLLLVSIGTGRLRSILEELSLWRASVLKDLANLPGGLIESISVQQDFLCRVMGSCIFGDKVDREVGAMIQKPGGAPPDRKFTYVRYDHEFGGDDYIEAVKKFGPMSLDNLRTMPFLSELGRKYAGENVRIEHLL